MTSNLACSLPPFFFFRMLEYESEGLAAVSFFLITNPR